MIAVQMLQTPKSTHNVVFNFLDLGKWDPTTRAWMGGNLGALRFILSTAGWHVYKTHYAPIL